MQNPQLRRDNDCVTKPAERERLLKFGKWIGKAIEKLITIVSPSTFYRWIQNEDQKKEVKNPKGGQRKPHEIRELIIQIAKPTVIRWRKRLFLAGGSLWRVCYELDFPTY